MARSAVKSSIFYHNEIRREIRQAKTLWAKKLTTLFENKRLNADHVETVFMLMKTAAFMREERIKNTLEARAIGIGRAALDFHNVEQMNVENEGKEMLEKTLQKNPQLKLDKDVLKEIVEEWDKGYRKTLFPKSFKTEDPAGKLLAGKMSVLRFTHQTVKNEWVLDSEEKIKD